MKTTQLNYLYFDKNELICLGRKKNQPEQNVLVAWVKLDKRLKLRIGKGNKVDCADVGVAKRP